MLTMVASSAVISWASAMKASPIHRRSAACGRVGLACCSAELISAPSRREQAGHQPDRNGQHDDHDRGERRRLEGHEKEDAKRHRKQDVEDRESTGMNSTQW